MTYHQWARSRKHGLAELDRDPKAYFEAVDFMNLLAEVLGDG